MAYGLNEGGFGGGNRGRFGPGMTNPSYGGPSTTPMSQAPRQGGGRVSPIQPIDYQLEGRIDAMDKPWMGNWAGGSSTGGGASGQKSYSSGANNRGVVFSGGRIEDQKVPAWLRELREKAGAREGFNEPDIPEFGDWEGEKWAPSRSYDEQAVDTEALITATDALINEQLGTTMSEAARRYGSAGALMSGGGIGGGFSGTLAESERGSMRDRAEMRHRYRFQAEQAEAERRARAFEGEMGREHGSFEGGQSRSQRQSEARNRFAQDRYGMELGVSGRERDEFQEEIDMMMSLYGG